ncbi:MAG TPA: hypothetical protein VFP53_02425 [Sphingomicrobium sp.]|nr:hypothetical protein [Sphingomicrobium sp.]
MRLSLLIICAALPALAACGSMGDLEPPEDRPLPVKPLMAKATPTPEELLTPPAYANPVRVDELMKRSTPRQADRFDLPPPTGQAPGAIGQDTEDDQPDDVGPATEQ